MRLFFEFIIRHRHSVIIFLVFSAIFAGVFFLYNTHVEAVLYAGIICCIIGAFIILVGFIRFRKRHFILKNISENLPVMLKNMPESDNLIEQDLCEIIKKLDEIDNKNITLLKNARQDSIDYFTVWVHQIKTPIAAMQMILQSEDTDTNREMLAELFRIEQYAQMALYYIRLDSKTTDYIIKKYDLDNIIRQAVHRYAPQFIRRRIRLIYSPVNAYVLTDEKWLLFIIEQLLSNAVKYTVKGSVTIKYTDNILTVADTGIGISAEDIPRIFEKGYTGLSGRTHKKSTGLGLYLCRRISDNLGHTLSVKSETGKGSEFSIDLSYEKFDIE